MTHHSNFGVKSEARRAGALEWVESFQPGPIDHLARSRRLTLDLLRHSRSAFDRTNYQPGHVTGSGLVISPIGNRVLLVFHGRLQLWLQPGGHVEADDLDVLATARREVQEETGVALLPVERPCLVGVDVHEIPAGRGEPPHLHHDLMFRLLAASDDLGVSPEARQVVWCRIDELERYQVDDVLLRSARRAVDDA